MTASADPSTRPSIEASVVERASLMQSGEGVIDASALPQSLLNTDTLVRSVRSEVPTLRELEGVYIHWVLENSRGTKADAAKILGISRKSLWEKCKRFGIA